MKVLVTGGAGYIGSHTVHQLVSNNTDVVVIDNFSTGSELLVNKKAALIRGHVGDPSTLITAEKHGPFDAIIHFAASTKVEESTQNPLKYYENNFVQTLEICKFAIKNKISKFVFSSTAAVYEAHEKRAILETDKLAPVSPYGKSKLACENLLLDIKSSYSFFDPIIFRYFNVAGAKTDNSIGQITKDATHLIKVCCEVATGKRDHLKIFGTDYDTADGTAERDFIHVEDIASAHVLALNTSTHTVSYPIFNLGYGKSYSVKEIAETIEKLSEKKMNIQMATRRLGDLASVKANSSKAINTLKWSPQFDSIQIICKTAYEWELKLKNVN